MDIMRRVCGVIGTIKAKAPNKPNADTYVMRCKKS